MITPKIIKNLYLNGGKIQAIGRNRTLTDVFARQGNLDGACCVYSLMMLAYSKKKGCGHAVVVIGYSKEKGNKLRLYCLDPSAPLGYLQVWNNIIELDYFSLDDESFTDYNYRTEENVLVNKILIIKDDKPKEPEYPF